MIGKLLQILSCIVLIIIILAVCSFGFYLIKAIKEVMEEEDVKEKIRQKVKK